MGAKPVGISASRGAAVLGLGKYEGQTVFAAWQQICEERRPGFNAERGYVVPPPVDNAAVRWGAAFEDAIVELASAKQGRFIYIREHFFSVDGKGKRSFIEPYDPECFITCHIDGAYESRDGETEPPLHEGKTTSLFAYWDAWGTPGTDRIPQGYQVQGQHQMLCTGAAECIVSVLVFPRRADEWEKEGWIVKSAHYAEKCFHYFLELWPEETKHTATRSCSEWARTISDMGLFHQYPVAAKPSLQSMLVDGYRHFWDHYVITEREPPLDAYTDIRRAFPAPVGTIVLSEQEERWITERKAITEEISDSGRLGKRKEELRVLVLNSIRSRIERDSVIDTESQDKVVFVDARGKRLGSYDGKTFR
jgi:predicted phage-related endonuclease